MSPYTIDRIARHGYGREVRAYRITSNGGGRPLHVEFTHRPGTDYIRAYKGNTSPVQAWPDIFTRKSSGIMSAFLTDAGRAELEHTDTRFAANDPENRALFTCFTHPTGSTFPGVSTS